MIKLSQFKNIINFDSVLMVMAKRTFRDYFILCAFVYGRNTCHASKCKYHHG